MREFLFACLRSFRILLILLLLALAGCNTRSGSSGLPHGSIDAVWIEPAASVDLDGMHLYWRRGNIMQFAADTGAAISLYVDAERHESGRFLFDDRQAWLLVLETSMGVFPLFPRAHVQLGGVSCAVFNDADERFHVLVTVRETAGYRIYDCVFDSERRAFRAETIYNAEAINFIAESYEGGQI